MNAGAVAFTSMWADLHPIGRDTTSGGYRRFAWTREDAVLREWFAGQAATRGLDLTTDRAGNQWAWWGDPDAAVAAGRPGLVLGSHLDSVPDGGAYDGPLGVVSALAVIDNLRERGVTPDRPIGVAVFADEEGARFGVACAGSRIITGALAPDRIRGLADAESITMAQAIRQAGLDPAALGQDEETLRRIGSFVELHVEQGRGLIDLDSPVAVASSILPHGRWRLDLIGEANHAGTTRLQDRRDPMLTLAEVIGTARTSAAARGCVATVGKLQVEPNAINAIPSRVLAWLDARGQDEAEVRRVAAAVGRVGGEISEESFTTATLFDPDLRDRLAADLGDVPVLPTGAGHDAGVLAQAGVASAMLFVRNPTGISHSPAEYAEPDDCLVGVTALTEVATALSGRSGQARAR